MKRLIAPLLTTLLAACASAPTAPPPGVTALAPPGAGASLIQIPLHLDTSALQQAVDAALPAKFDATRDWVQQGKAFIKYAWQRDPVTITAAGDTGISVETTVHYQARVALHLGGRYQEVTQCGFGEAEPSLEHVGLTVRIGASARWVLKPQVSVNAIEPGTPCKVVLGLDASQEIAKQVQDRLQQKLSEAQQKAAAGLDVSQAAAAAWSTLSKPYVFTGPEPGYFMLNPEQASLGFLTTDGGLTLAIGLTAAPLAALGVPPPATTAPALPLLKVGGVGDTIRVVLPIEISYASLQQALSQSLVGHTYSLGQDKEQVDEVQVYGSARSIAIRVDLSGSSKDTLYLTGEAVYDATAGTLSLSKFDYTLDTQDRLQHAEEWLLHSALRDDLQAKAQVRLSDRLDTLKAALQTALNRPLNARADLTGDIQDLKPLGVVLSDDFMTAYFVAEGRLQVDLH